MPPNATRVLATMLAVSIVPAFALPMVEAPRDRPETRGILAEPVTPIPQPDATDSALVDLGSALFASPLLSRDNARSCLNCHDIETNGAEARRVSVSPSGQALKRNAPTVFNAALSFRQGWEGDLRTLQEEAARAILGSDFMDGRWDDILPKLRADAELDAKFRRAYGRQADSGAVLDALAAYEGTLLTPGSRFDRWLGGEANALTPHELEGYQLFKSVGCVSCHQGVNFGGNLYEKAGIFQPLFDHPPTRMRVPSLRNVAVTAPYFDDGSAPTLEEAVRRMARAQLGRQLTGEQIDTIAAFLVTLTGNYQGRPLQAAR